MIRVDLSVVIPSYNASETVSRALSSLMDERCFGHYEVIVVDDGSTDSTSGILEEWSSRYPGIVHVLRQDNAGVSAARNAGMEVARGDYIAFVDADDYVESDYVKTSLEAIQGGADFVTFNYIKERGGARCTVSPEPVPSSIELACKLALTCTANSPWSKLYRRSLTKGLLFPRGQSLGEDLCFNLSFLERAKTAEYIPKPSYVYVDNEGSRMSRAPRISDSKDYNKMLTALLGFSNSCNLGTAGKNSALISMARILANYAARLKRNGVRSRDITTALHSIDGYFDVCMADASEYRDKVRLWILKKNAFLLAALLLRGGR